MTALTPLWLAHDEGGEAHARSHGPAPRTACGELAPPERFCYPLTGKGGRCEPCSAVVEAARRDAKAVPIAS